MLEVQLRMLQGLGYSQLTTAATAQEALLQLEHDPHSAELLVCDLAMPDMDGIQFLQTLNASPFRGSVILLSGISARVMHTVQKLLGGSQLTILGALTKPATPGALRGLLECWTPQTGLNATTQPLIFTADDLRAASRERQWVVHYQPQVDLKTGEVVGMEALVRWTHPRYGLLHPEHFILQAEQCGAIDGLTDQVVSDSLAQQASWRSTGLRVQMAINVSTQNLQTPDFWRILTGGALGAGVAPQDVTLEITETRLMSSSRAPLENLVRLRLQGFNLSIDDFGVGHSSLAQLRDLPFTELKVDRGFVKGARNNQIVRPILEGSLGIAKRMGMRSVAEGVETEDDWRLMRELECDMAQGHFIAQPMPVEHVEEWLQLWQARRAGLVGG